MAPCLWNQEQYVQFLFELLEPIQSEYMLGLTKPIFKEPGPETQN